MTGDPTRRWPDDSADEDFEVHRATDAARLDRWAGEQKLKPLTDALESHGLLPGDGEGWTGREVVPDWWDEIPVPALPCPWCQRPGVPVPCRECEEGRAAGVDPVGTWGWWAALPADRRRLHIAATYRTDPWSGRRCMISIEQADVDAEGKIATTCPVYTGCAPAGIFWGAERRGLA